MKKLPWDSHALSITGFCSPWWVAGLPISTRASQPNRIHSNSTTQRSISGEMGLFSHAAQSPCQCKSYVKMVQRWPTIRLGAKWAKAGRCVVWKNENHQALGVSHMSATSTAITAPQSRRVLFPSFSSKSWMFVGSNMVKAWNKLQLRRLLPKVQAPCLLDEAPFELCGLKHSCCDEF